MTMTACMFQIRFSAIALSSRAPRSSANPASDGFAALKSSIAAEPVPIDPPINAPPVAASTCRRLKFVSIMSSLPCLQRRRYEQPDSTPRMTHCTAIALAALPQTEHHPRRFEGSIGSARLAQITMELQDRRRGRVSAEDEAGLLG